jgi:hypothetical protein
MQMPFGVHILGRIATAGPAKGAFCGFRLFFKSIRTATACLAGRLWAGLYGNAGILATTSAIVVIFATSSTISATGSKNTQR